jgi:type II secretory ATPase GspE/PulE/Tfp pilus assembly ATPase PilB-like protein
MVLAITITTPQTIMRTLKQRFADLNISFILISDFGFKELMLRHDPPQEIKYDDIDIKTEGASQSLENVSKTLETVRSDDILSYLITQADRLGASDIHLENEKDHVRMRFRIDGTLHGVANLSKDKYRQLMSSIAVKSNVSVADDEPQTGHMVYELAGEDGKTKSLNMRLETAPSSNGQDVVIRLFSLDREVMTLENLGLSSAHRERIDDVIRHPHGLVLVVGPTGSGKTTTLYSILDKLNSPTRKIITLEDPVEYAFAGVTQIPVKTKEADNSFADKLRAVLRLDPDVIMVGEIRDVDTAKTAMQAALTGHLVLSTFHGANAAAAMARMMDVIGENPLFLNAVRLVIGQRLVRRLDESTKQPYQPDDQLKAEIQKVIDGLPEGVDRPNLDEVQLFNPGKSEQNPFGYAGRLMVAEQLNLTPNVQNLIKQSGARLSVDELEQAAHQEGMVTMTQDGVLKALAGQTTLEEVYRVVDI